MRIQSKGLNPNETYCCTQKDVKSFFGDTDIEIFFGIFNISRNESLNSEKYRPHKTCDDRIIAKMVLHKRTIDCNGYNASPYISFFIMDKKGYTSEMRLKFISEVLPKLRELYDEHISGIDDNGTFAVTVGIKEMHFNLYESIV